MSKNLLTGAKVRLTAEEPSVLAEADARWERDSEFFRLWAADPVRLRGVKKLQERFEEPADGRDLALAIRTIAEDRLIGFISLFDIHNQHGNCFVGIGIGERDYWGKGYGSEAMQLILDLAFSELNRHRVSLTVLANNARAIASYRKSGFVDEGVTRGGDHRDGVHTDLLEMGILRSEWLARSQENRAE